MKIEIEVESVDEAREAVDGGADIVMLDNMSLGEIREAVRIVKGRCLTEVSGGVTLDQVAEIAATGGRPDIGRRSDPLGKGPGHRYRRGTGRYDLIRRYFELR